MGTLTNRAGIYKSGVGWIHLPPFDGDIVPSEIIREEHHPIPHAALTDPGLISLMNDHVGWNLSIEGFYNQANPESGLVWQDQLRDHMRDANGKAVAVDVAEWDDTDSIIKRYYRACLLVSPIHFQKSGGMRSARNRLFRFQMISTIPSRFVTESDAGRIPAGPYENLLYSTGAAGSVTPPATSITITTGASEILAHFSGRMNAVTDANNVGTRQIAIKFPAAVDLSQLQIVSADKSVATGTTTFRLSTTNFATAGSGIEAGILSSETQSPSPAAGTVSIAANAYAYLYLPAAGAGNHERVNILFNVQRT